MKLPSAIGGIYLVVYIRVSSKRMTVSRLLKIGTTSPWFQNEIDARCPRLLAIAHQTSERPAGTNALITPVRQKKLATELQLLRDGLIPAGISRV